MMNTTCYRLVVCEKPSVARSIAAVLGAGRREDGFLSGGGYLVSWCFGHLAELSDADAYDEKYGKWRREDLPILPESWQYTVARDKQKQMNTLRALMHREDVCEVVNACDAGREGELIFRTAYNLNNCRKRVKRLWISSMEDAAILQGFDNLRDGAEYEPLRLRPLPQQGGLAGGYQRHTPVFRDVPPHPERGARGIAHACAAGAAGSGDQCLSAGELLHRPSGL